MFEKLQMPAIFMPGFFFTTVTFILKSHQASSVQLVINSTRAKNFQNGSTVDKKLRNVLFIVVDDLRPNLGAYNFTLGLTPNMDRLAATGMTFKRSYVQFPFCAPSRNSFMSGRRPDTTRAFNTENHFREPGIGAGWTSLPEYFKTHGFVTLGSGKLFHHNLPPEFDGNRSWSEGYEYFWPFEDKATPELLARFGNATVGDLEAGTSFSALRKHAREAGVSPIDLDEAAEDDDPVWSTLNLLANEQGSDVDELLAHESVPKCTEGGRKKVFCTAEVSVEEKDAEQKLPDQKIRESCIEQLRIGKDVVQGGGNFFVGCGFMKPHVQWIVPEEILSKVPRQNNIALPPEEVTAIPRGMPDIAWHTSAASVKMKPHSPTGSSHNSDRERYMRRGYYAAVAWVDYNIGKVLDELDDLELTDDTVVILFGDHGWHLGERSLWGKYSNFELDLRVPTIIRAPWLANSVGRETSILAEAVDFYPTLAELAGLPEPQSQGENVHGVSLARTLLNPSDVSLKKAAFSQHAKPFEDDPFKHIPTPPRGSSFVMGYSVRVDKWRYTAWFRCHDGDSSGADSNFKVYTDQVVARELYWHGDDDGSFDYSGAAANLVEEESSIASSLHQQLLQYIASF